MDDKQSEKKARRWYHNRLLKLQRKQSKLPIRHDFSAREKFKAWLKGKKKP